MTEKFDAIIVGTGQAGPALAARMTREGMKTAIIERKLFGGTCVNVGCIPTKTLVASARAAYMARVGRARERSETQGFMKSSSTPRPKRSSGPRSWGSAATRSSTRCST